MNRSFLFSILLSVLGVLFQAQELVTNYPGAVSAWNGGVRHDFQLNGVFCTIVEPGECAPGRPWYWKARFFDAFPYPEIALLKEGWTIAYTDVADLYGAPDAVRRFDQFYRFMLSRGYHRAPALAGYSRGGLIAINFASRYPERVSSLYLDNAVCDFRTWPGSGKYPQGWEDLRKAYGLTEAAAVNSPWDPVERLQALAVSGVPVLALCALKDTVVPPETNTKRLEEIFKTHGGDLTVLNKPEADHHPHSLENPAPIVEFVQKNFTNFTLQKEYQDVPMPWNPDFRCQYDSRRKLLVVTLWQWPQEQRVVLGGISGEPEEIWMECNGEKYPLPCSVRPDGWYIFLPAVQPSEGDQRLFIQLQKELETQQPVLRMTSTEDLRLNAANGMRKDGIWRWQVYTPGVESYVVRFAQPHSVSLKISNGEEQAELLPGQQLALLNGKESLQTIALDGLSELEYPNLEIGDLRSAVMELSISKAQTMAGKRAMLHGTDIILDKSQQKVKWELPFALDADFMVVAQYACGADCGVDCVHEAERTVLDFHATGDQTRFLFLPVGQIRMTSNPVKPEICLGLQHWGSLVLRKILLVPAGVEHFCEELVTGDSYDAGQKDLFTLPLDQARLIGGNLRIVKGNNCITHWWLPTEYVIWPITNVKPGRYVVKANIGTIETSRLAFNAGGETLLAEIPNTHDYDACQPFVFGEVEISRAQDAWLQIYPASGYNAVNLSEVTLERKAE